MAIYITSDLHFGHDKQFLYQPRGFDNIYDHDKEIIRRWNSIITPEDEVYILGDLMFGDNEYGIKHLNRLNGNKFIVRGNHDTDTRLALYTAQPEHDVKYCGEAITLNYKKFHFYLSHYPTICSNFDDGKFLRQRTINLCGHSHTKDAFSDWNRYNSAIFHCELDAHNCYPINIDNVIESMKKRWEEQNNEQ